jgi:hypothetical protein
VRRLLGAVASAARGEPVAGERRLTALADRELVRTHAGG